MNWNCEQTELRLSDYLDGLLVDPVERREMDAHVRSCSHCTGLLRSVSHAVRSLRALEELEEPPRLVYNILDQTLGARERVSGWRAVVGWVRGLASPRFAYGVLSVGATFIVVLGASGFSFRKPKLADLRPASIYRNADRQVHLVYARSTKFVSDLRVVYEIQSRLSKDDSLPVSPDSGTPDSSPANQPGRTDGTQPASPKQQNRANDILKPIEVLAVEFPVFLGRKSP